MHAIIVGLAYIIMLIVMSFNGYVIICVIVGAGLGRFLCDWTSRTILVGGVDEPEGSAALLEEPGVCCG